MKYDLCMIPENIMDRRLQETGHTAKSTPASCGEVPRKAFWNEASVPSHSPTAGGPNFRVKGVPKCSRDIFWSAKKLSKLSAEETAPGGSRECFDALMNTHFRLLFPRFNLVLLFRCTISGSFSTLPAAELKWRTLKYYRNEKKNKILSLINNCYSCLYHAGTSVANVNIPHMFPQI